MSPNFFYPSILGPAVTPDDAKTDDKITLDKVASLQQKLADEEKVAMAVTILRIKYAGVTGGALAGTTNSNNLSA
jgi:hypothetical protein